MQKIPEDDSALPSFFERFKTHVWGTELADMTRFRRLLAASTRIGVQVAKDIWDGQLTLRAMSLVYTTLLSLVPLLAISFSVLKGFGVHREIKPFLITFLAPLGDKAEEISLRFVEFIDNTSVTVLGYVGFALLFYAAISLMQKIERAFNFVWRVEESRSLLERVRDYLTLIIIGPTFLFATTGLWATIIGTNSMEALAGVAPFGWFLDGAARMLPVLLVILTFTFLYAFVPNTKVHWRPALIGGTIAGVLWNAGGVGFAVFVGNSANYPAIYSGFATAIFFMIWLYLSWMILLIGGSISFYAQNPHFANQRPLALSIRMQELLAFAVAAAVGRRFYRGEPPHTAETIAGELRLPTMTVESVLAPMESARLVIRAGAEGKAYVPHQSWDAVPISALISCIRTQGESDKLAAFDVEDAQVLDLWARFNGGLTSGVNGLCLKELAQSPEQISQVPLPPSSLSAH